MLTNYYGLGKTVVNATVAYACLTSVPINRQNALNLLDSMRPYMDWQSDTPWRSNPPSSFGYPAHDMYAVFDTVRDNVVNNRYTNEYAFQADVMGKIYNPAHDGHMLVIPDALGRALRFGRYGFGGLVSFSSDGNATPQIKFKNDVDSRGDQALAITKINGKAASDFVLGNSALAGGSQDVDASYNTQFYQLAQKASNGGYGEHSLGGRDGFMYQGQWTNYTMSDGTVRNVENVALIQGDFSGITDGQSFYNRFCDPLWNDKHPAGGGAGGLSAASGAAAAAVTQLPGYPKPVVISRDGTASGYYLEGNGYNTTAVLTLTSFAPQSNSDFQDVVSTFLAKAVRDGKTKLILDLQANGGGFIYLGYDLFRQLFPQTIPDGDSRFKSTKTWQGLAKMYSKYIDDHPTENLKSVAFAYQNDFNSSNKHFTSIQDKSGPYTYRNTPYTSRMRYDFESLKGVGGITVTGYGNRTNGTQPFLAENIVLLYDGYCASTCTIVSELLRLQAGVKSVVFGGRPTRDAMQGVGGVKGSNIYSYDVIKTFVQDGVNISTDKDDQADFARYNDLAINRTLAASHNVRDAILRPNFADGMPAQYVYEAADCRKYWTKAMLDDSTAIWKATADSGFANASCINGGITRSARRARGVLPPFVPQITKPIEDATHFLVNDNYKVDDLSPKFISLWKQKVESLIPDVGKDLLA